MRLEGRRILISGAASGIGLGTARKFHAEGAAVALLDRDAAGLDAACRDLGALGGPQVASVHVDVTDDAGVRAAVDAGATALGGLDGLVGCSGIDLLKPFEEMSVGEWRAVLDTNLTGAFSVTSAAVPHIRAAGGGTIVHVTSGAGLRPLRSRTAYCASKAGLEMFAKALAIDLAPHDIRVNTICPGIIESPLFRQTFDGVEDPDGELEAVLDRYLIRRIGTPEDIAYAALYLTSRESAHVTGSSLSVDGGRTFH